VSFDESGHKRGVAFGVIVVNAAIDVQYFSYIVAISIIGRVLRENN
jgi:hypothetical protein